MRPRLFAAACAALLAVGALATRSPAQSMLDRSPNLNGAWVGNSGQLYFNFMHRFITSEEPLRKVSNFPTFTVAAGLPFRTLVGFHYSTNSTLTPSYPNEWEFFVRHALLQQDRGAPVDVGGMVAYNMAAEGIDGELSLGRRIGPLRLVAAGRALSDPFEEGNIRWAVAGGGTLRISRYFALAADVATLVDLQDAEESPTGQEERIAWSAGVHLAIPHTPHTLSLQATNTNVYSLQGASRGEEDVRYGFEFTIPLTLSRWFGRSGGGATTPPLPPPAAQSAAAEPAGNGKVVKAGMRNLAYVPARIEIEAGTTVEWTNNDPLAHTVTAADRSFDSGPIESGRTWRHTFTAPGSYDFTCTPHPFMKGVVIVK